MCSRIYISLSIKNIDKPRESYNVYLIAPSFVLLFIVASSSLGVTVINVSDL